MDIPAEGIYKVTGDNASMGVASANYIVEKIGTTGTVVALPLSLIHIYSLSRRAR